MGDMTIGGLARAGGVGVETIRYYQRRGLLAEPEQGSGAGSRGPVRRYGEVDIGRLRFIRAAKAAGFSLEEVAQLLRFDGKADRSSVRALARHRLAALDRRLAELQSARAWLADLEAACASGEDGSCPILAAFENGGGRHSGDAL